MKKLKKLNKKGFTLMEALVATVLVTVAASMSVGAFVTNAHITQQQREVNKGQNSALSNAEGQLNKSGSTSAGEAFVMEPTGGNGFSALEDNGRVSAKYNKSGDDKASYVYFQYSDEEPVEVTTE